ncbi:bifunctional D-glycero-beta-D-manno-heptose-7-phosphate kinase/D-glycero-beta-D-manno-heptose 1-phosphate adenylyltransferase HldE [Thiofaba sp. EF100]|uniref:bifunctional D-glycero-beta-D-manno-heptose-7-phosphate kinase/D-glycero-beta-D-manno-heptose 1-phosphate adenylyltransferase HldE n=1 Tax=Thiofaba sp. EF100 TaxID=3121274 RepID=UPI0032221F4F
MLLDLPDFSRAHVLVAGDVMLDRYWHGATSRISPEAPVPVVKVEGDELRVGGAGNVALNVTALGAGATLAALVGHDPEAATLRERLETGRVACRLLAAPGSRTITKLRIISRHQQLIRLDFEDGFPAASAAAMPEAVQGALAGAGALVLSDYAKGALKHAQAMIQAARAAGVPVVVDPKGTDFERYRGATVLTPNLAEFEAVAGPCMDEATLVSRGEALRDQLDLTALLITRSERGMTLLVAGQPALHLPARAREVFDVTGAGDTVVAVLAAGLAAGMRLPEATALANLAAGVVVGKLGTATVSLDELAEAMQGHTPLPTGVMDEERLLEVLARARAAGERIVMTNGCFDILHPGHITYLHQARALGDRLIVAVNDDDSVRRLKGPSRPVNGLETRMLMLAALSSVDWVVPFSEDTPERLICRLKPDVLVKGGDYRPEDIAGGPCVIDHGGEVKVLGFVEGHSTSGLIARIQETP